MDYSEKENKAIELLKEELSRANKIGLIATFVTIDILETLLKPNLKTTKRNKK